MKKVLAICLMIIFVLSTSVTAFAAVGGFVSSPSGNRAPELIDSSNESDDCVSEPIITPYSERDTLSEKHSEEMEKAYEIIRNNPDLSKILGDLKKIADDKNIDVTKLAVSDLFNISYTDCDSHDGHGNFNITLKPDSLKNFVALMYFDGENWKLVDGARVSEDGKHLLFTTNYEGTFAIVTNTGAASGATPQTGDNSKVMLYAVVMLVSAASLVVLWFILKKRTA